YETPTGPTGIGLAGDHRAFQLGVVEVRAAEITLVPQQYAFVGRPDEQGASFGRGMQGDHLDPVPELGVQFSDGPNQPDRRLATIDDRYARKHSGSSSICADFTRGSVCACPPGHDPDDQDPPASHPGVNGVRPLSQPPVRGVVGDFAGSDDGTTASA